MSMLLPFLLALFPTCSADLTMIIVWGKPDDSSGCTLSNYTTMKECYSGCYSVDDCVVAFMDLSSQECLVCTFKSVDNVMETSYTENLKTAIKVNISAACLNSVSDEGQVILGYNQTLGLVSNSYEITYSNSTWQFQYIVIKSCPTNWEMFQRQMGPWCIQVSYNVTYNTSSPYNTWDEAQALCSQDNAVLTSIEESTELNYISSIMNTQDTNTWICTYLGGVRRPECVSPNWNATICNNSDTSFYWTDGFTVGTAGFLWSTGNPSGSINTITKEEQSCMAVVTNLATSSLNDLIDDTFCSDLAYCASFACGKQPGV